MMQVIAWILASFAVGGTITVLLLCGVYISIHMKKGSLSEYYFDIPRKPMPPSLADIISEALCSICFALLYIIAIITISLALSGCISGPTAIENVVVFLQDGINVLVSIMITVIIIFSSFRKPYYILFTTDDVMKRYKIYRYALFSFLIWIFCFGIMVVDKVAVVFGATGSGILMYSTLLLFQLACLALLGIVIYKSCRIIFSQRSFELQILDTLYYNISDLDSYLKRIAPEDVKNMTIISNRFVEELRKKSAKIEPQLKECMELFSVKFWDAIDIPPRAKEKHVLFPISFLIAYSFFMGLFILFILFLISEIEGPFAAFGFQNLPFIISLSITVLYLLAHLFASYPPLVQMRRAVLYGRWGYLFSDKAGSPQFYIPRYPLYAGKAVKWFRALLNILTLCRIECVNDCTDDLLKKLHDTLSEFSARSNGDEETFTFELVYYLCLKLAQEMKPTVEYRGELNQVLRETSHKELLVSWADAIWVDMKRDMNWYRKHYGSAGPATASVSVSKP